MSIRITYFINFFIIVLVLTASAYLQLFDGFQPCPLCTLQRFTFILLGCLFFIGIFLCTKRWGRFLVNLLAATTAILGILLSGRQIWLQHFAPAKSDECMVSLQYMLDAFPLSQVIEKILFDGSAECTKRGWEFLHLNMAEWALAFFVLFFVVIIYLFLKEFFPKRYFR